MSQPAQESQNQNSVYEESRFANNGTDPDLLLDMKEVVGNNAIIGSFHVHDCKQIVLSHAILQPVKTKKNKIEGLNWSGHLHSIFKDIS